MFVPPVKLPGSGAGRDIAILAVLIFIILIIVDVVIAIVPKNEIAVSSRRAALLHLSFRGSGIIH